MLAVDVFHLYRHMDLRTLPVGRCALEPFCGWERYRYQTVITVAKEHDHRYQTVITVARRGEK